VAGLKVLEQAGYRPRLARHIYDRRGHLAGTDAARADDLNRMLRDPDIRCVLMARGGYGAMRIATEVDWGAMRRDPKIFAGYSDATFLHLGFQARSGVRTLHGPNLHGLGFRRRGEIVRWLRWLSDPHPAQGIRELAVPLKIVGSSQMVSGRVLGGNLALVNHAACTSYIPSLRGAIVFFEEVNEPPYKIDCWGSGEYWKDGTGQDSGYCKFTFSDGAYYYETWSGKVANGHDTGTAVYYGGAGRFKGMKGGSKFDARLMGDRAAVDVDGWIELP
jgi:muramoyltetrapeptide carboxypeptidase LdcA involved in peptidoglycan recycling